MSPTKAPVRPAFAVAAADLKAAAAWVARTIPQRPTHPVLGAIVLDARDGVLTLSAFDYETYASVAVPVAGGLPERVLVHGRLLADATARLTGPTRVELDGPDVIVTAERGVKFRLRTLPVDEYPDVPPQAPDAGTIAAEALADLVHCAAACAATTTDDKTLAILMSLHLTAVEGRLTAWASDRYRAAQVTAAWSGSDFDICVPARALADAIKGMAGTLTLGVDENRITITGPDRTVTITTTAGEFPDLPRLWVATTRSRFVHVPRDDFADAIATARVGIEGKSIHVDVVDGAVTVTGGGERATSRVDVPGDGDLTVKWALNHQLIAELVAVTPGPRVHLMADDARPDARGIEIRGADADGEPIAGITYLLNPIREVHR